MFFCVTLKCISMLGDMFFFLGSRLGDSLFVQFTCGSTAEVIFCCSDDG